MERTGSMRKRWAALRAQPGALVVLGCVGGVVALLAVAWVVQLGWGRRATVVVALPPEPMIRVRVMRSEVEVVIGGPAWVEVGAGEGEAGQSTRVVVAGPIEVRWEDGSIVGRDADGIVHEWGGGEVWFSSMVGEGSAGEEPLRVGARRYPGRIRLVGRDAGFDVVNDVLIDSYLPGVIAQELYGHWDEEAFAVQAICARGYALHVLGQVSPGRSFDINASESAQTYVGVTENVKAIEAVRETRGLALVFEGEVIRSYYSSTCGGRSGSAADAFGARGKNVFNAVGPLEAHDRPFACENAPLFRWSRTRGVDSLSARLAAFGEDRRRAIKGLKRIERIEIVGQAVTGRPTRYAVHDVGGEVFEISAEDLRLACNYRAAGLDRPGDTERVMSNDLVFVVHGSEIEIAGRGFGHGVGMCQYGANAMAQRGVPARTMLGLFYPGATVERRFE
jgi:stage II sporulation protein D (peptidoglycan lytic transglycosylase)